MICIGCLLRVVGCAACGNGGPHAVRGAAARTSGYPPGAVSGGACPALRQLVRGAYIPRSGQAPDHRMSAGPWARPRRAKATTRSARTCAGWPMKRLPEVGRGIRACGTSTGRDSRHACPWQAGGHDRAQVRPPTAHGPAALRAAPVNAPATRRWSRVRRRAHCRRGGRGRCCPDDHPVECFRERVIRHG